jgi:4-aminobutyrate aminotransferase-like enzyme
MYGNVIRFLTPLTIPDAHLKEGFHLFEECLDEVVRQGENRSAAAG